MPFCAAAAAPTAASARATALVAVVALVCASACGDALDEPAKPSGVSAEVSDDIATVVTVRWATPGESRGYVEYGTSEDMSENTPLEADASQEHELLLLGLEEDTEYFYRVVTWDGADAGASGVGSFRTGDLPSALPTFAPEGEGHEELTLVPVSGDFTGVVVLDPEGRVVWYHEDDRDFQITRALLSADGKSIVYNAQSQDEELAEDSELVRVSLDGSEQTSTSVPLLTGDFLEHEDGTLAALVVDKLDPEDPSQWGNQIVEVDEDGDITEVWSTSECFDPADDPGDDPAGWTLANALDYSSSDDAYYVGLRGLSSIARVNRESGECELVLGSVGASVEFADDAEPFLHQDQFSVRKPGTDLLSVVVCDNEGSPDGARIVEYEVDLTANTATQTWSYGSNTSASSPGEPTRFGNGDTFISWGESGLLERVNEDGDALWTLDTEGEVGFGYHTLIESLYLDD